MVAPIILDAMDLVPADLVPKDLVPKDLVEVPAGWFWMGWEHGHPAERPRHRVWLDPFAIARAPVTNRAYAEFLADGETEPPAWWRDPRFNDPEQPVVGVSWFDATRFCRWLADRQGVSYRLPTEAEWEKAARAGLDDARFPWGEDRPGTASFDRPPRPTETPANPLGLLALSGVCHEWCLDWEDEAYYARSPSLNPRGPETGTRRVAASGRMEPGGAPLLAASGAALLGLRLQGGERAALISATRRAARPRPGPASSACPSRGAGPPPR
jgi:formylglycine-generating enzyme required for sulfatase activity